MRLLRSELARFRSRRAIVLLLALGFVLSVVVTGTLLWENRPLGDDDRAEALQQAQVQVDDCERHPQWFGHKGHPERCVRILDRAERNPEAFVGRFVQPYQELATDLPLALMVPLVFVALLAGITFVGADLASGSMSTTLLFRPSRWKVWAAKMAATVLWTALWAALTLAPCLLALALTSGADEVTGMVAGDGAALLWRGVRVLLVVVGAALLGAAMTSALRSTIAAVGVAMGYLLAGEAVLRSVFMQSIEPWLGSTRVVAFVRPDLELYRWDESGMEETRTLVEMWPSAIYLAVVVGVTAAVSAAVFARRDLP